MAQVSRRALLIAGGASAGAAVTSGGQAQAADSGSEQEAQSAETAFISDEFSGTSDIGDIDARMEVSFSIRTDNAPAGNNVSPQEVAEAINALVTSRGWPPVQFFGTVRAPLT